MFIHPYLLGNVAALPKRRGAAVNPREAAPEEQGFSLLTFHDGQSVRGSQRSVQYPINTPPFPATEQPTMHLSELSVISPRTNKFWPGRTRAPLSERQRARYGGSSRPLCWGDAASAPGPGSSDRPPPTAGILLQYLLLTPASPRAVPRRAGGQRAGSMRTQGFTPTVPRVHAHGIGKQTELKN